MTMALKKDVQFCVAASVVPGESVFVVGDCEQLGEWLPHCAVPLQQQQQISPGQDTRFVCTHSNICLSSKSYCMTAVTHTYNTPHSFPAPLL